MTTPAVAPVVNPSTSERTELNSRKVVYYTGSDKNIFGNPYTIAFDKNEDGKVDISEGAPEEIDGIVAV